MPASELRVIPDGWESGNASGKVKGVTDGRCEVHIIAPLEGFDATTEAKVDNFNYRRSETVAYLEVGKTTHFALRIDPKTGNYDVYVDGVYKASSDKPAMPDMNPKIIFHDNGMGEFTYSNISVANESVDFGGKVVTMEVSAKFAPDESASENVYTALLAIERGEEKLNLLYVNNKTALLNIKDSEGNMSLLYDTNGVAISLKDGASISLVYDGINGDVRYFTGGKLAYYICEGKTTLAESIKIYNTDFITAEGADSLRYSPANVTAVNVYGVGASDTAEIVGFQSNEIDNSIRLVAGLDCLYYGAVGYEVQAFRADGSAYGKTLVKTSSAVYESIVAGGEQLGADKYGYNYFAALKIDGNLPDYKGCYIKVKPFTKVGASTYYGEEVRLNILDNGRYEFAENN